MGVEKLIATNLICRRLVRTVIAMGLLLMSALASARNYPLPNGVGVRDPNQFTAIISDFDESFAHNVNGYRVRLVQDPGMPGLGSFMGLPKTIDVPTWDFEADEGPRIRDLLATLQGSRIVRSAAIGEIKMSNGQTIRPGFYYLEPTEGYSLFRPAGDDPENGHLRAAIRQLLESEKPFLLEAAPFIAATFDKTWEKRVKGLFLTMRGHDPREMRAAIHDIRNKMKWGRVNWDLKQFVNLNHSDFDQFGRSKARYLDALISDLQRRVIKDHSVPHFVVMLENDRKHLDALDKELSNLANRGVMSNPVVPILVNLVEPKVFEMPEGLDWNRSKIESSRPNARVTIYWPGAVVPERTNDIARAYSLAFGIHYEQAKILFDAHASSPMMCRNVFAPVGGQP